jgi:hypothetical protein
MTLEKPLRERTLTPVVQWCTISSGDDNIYLKLFHGYQTGESAQIREEIGRSDVTVVYLAHGLISFPERSPDDGPVGTFCTRTDLRIWGT